MNQIINCSEYHNPFTTPYACITALDSLVVLVSVVIVFIIINTFID